MTQQRPPWLDVFRAPAVRFTIEEMLVPHEYIALRSTCTALHSVMAVVFALTTAEPEPDQPRPLANSTYLEKDRLVVGAAPHPAHPPPRWWLLLGGDNPRSWNPAPGRLIPPVGPQIPPSRFVGLWSARCSAERGHAHPWPEPASPQLFRVPIGASEVRTNTDGAGPVNLTYRSHVCSLPPGLKRLELHFKLCSQLPGARRGVLTQRSGLEFALRFISNKRTPGAPTFVPASVVHLEIQADNQSNCLIFPRWHMGSALRSLTLHINRTDFVTDLPESLEAFHYGNAFTPDIILPRGLKRLTVKYYWDESAIAWPPGLVFFRAGGANALPAAPTLRTIIIEAWSGKQPLTAAEFPPALEVLDVHLCGPVRVPFSAPENLPASLLVLRLTSGHLRNAPILAWPGPDEPVRFPPRLIVGSVDHHFASWGHLPPSIRVLCFADGMPQQSFWDAGSCAQLTGGLVFPHPALLGETRDLKYAKPHPWWGHLVEMSQFASRPFPRTYAPTYPTPHMWWGSLFDELGGGRVFPRTALRGPHDNEPLEM